MIARAAVLIVAIMAVSSCGSNSSPSTAPTLTAQISSVSPSGTAIVSTTVLTMSGAVSPASSSASYDWQFGDGGTASGQMVTHVYTQEGAPTVTLRVSSGGSSATATLTIQVKSVTGCWQETTKAADRASPDTHNLVQAGTAVTGTFISTPSDSTAARLVMPISGTLISPRVVAYTAANGNIANTRGFNLTASDTLAQLTGTLLPAVGPPAFVTLVPAAVSVCQ